MTDELVVPAGETKTIPSGTTVRASSVDVQGTLKVQGTLEIDAWELDGQALPPITELSLTARTLSLSFECPRDEVETWRQYDRAGDLTIEPGYGGAWRALDEGGRSGPVTIDPPSWFKPPLATGDYYINSYGEEQLAPDRVQVSLSGHRISPRSGAYSGVSESGPWQLETHAGTLGLVESQVTTVPAQGTTTGRQATLTVTVDADQAATLIDSLGYPDGVVERTVSDGANILRDESPDRRQTVRLVSPVGAMQDSAEILVRDWTLEPAGYEPRRRWRIELQVAQRCRLLTVQADETYTIESGETETYARADVDGKLIINGTLTLTGDC